jgi:hypothetical protein
MELLHRTSELEALCEHCNEAAASIKDGEYLDSLRDLQTLMKNFTPWTYLVPYDTLI